MTKDDLPIYYTETRYGFEYGAAKIERVMSHKGHVLLHVYTGKQLLSIRVTPSGLIRLSDIVKDWHDNSG
jgi:hypothetical protein